MKILYRYIFKELLPPYFFSIFLITGIMVVNEFILITDMILKKGVEYSVIFKMVYLSLAHIIALSIPMSVLLATIMTYGKLTEDNEIMAIKASGISLYSLLIPSLLFGLINTGIIFYFNNNILPDANYYLKNLEFRIKASTPTIALEEGKFNKIGDSFVLFCDNLDRKKNYMKNVVIYDYSKGRTPDIITSKDGIIAYDANKDIMILKLNYGEIYKFNKKNDGGYSSIKFNELVYKYNLSSDSTRDFVFNRGQREMNISMMNSYIDTLKMRIKNTKNRCKKYIRNDLSILLMGRKPITMTTYYRLKNEVNIKKNLEYQINQYKVEIHKKFAIAFACIIFVLLGVPLGVRSKRGGVGPSIIISMIFFVLSWGSLLVGEELGDKGVVPPWLAMWFSNIIFLIYGIFILYRTVRETRFIKWDRFDRLKRKLFPG